MAVNPVTNANARWEYMTMSYNSAYGSTTYEVNGEKQARLRNLPLHEVLTMFGQNGWELIGIAGAEGKTYLFKRQGVRSVNGGGDSAK